ncbi:MAG: hypothetical protein JO022_09520, partial [Acidobacteriaceae bacterium]|nr:hypothetical protein [Acidobacteriaceae bacterium]
MDLIEFNLGGNGANTSFALATLGLRVGLLSAVGQDDFGCEVIRKLTSAGVDVSGVQRIAGKSTPVSVVLVHPDGKRALLHSPGASREAFHDGIDLSELPLDGVRHFHLANLFTLQSFQKHAGKLLEQARTLGLSTSLDTGWDAQGLWLKTLEP